MAFLIYRTCDLDHTNLVSSTLQVGFLFSRISAFRETGSHVGNFHSGSNIFQQIFVDIFVIQGKFQPFQAGLPTVYMISS